MSVISEKVRVALYSKLNVSGVTSLATGGVHYQHAPNANVTPYVVFNRVAPGPVKRAAFGNQIIEDDLWQINAIVREGDSSTLEPVQLAQQILAACETAIGESLTLSGNTVEYCKRDGDIPSGKPELVNDSWVYYEGFNLRIQTS
jgi:hypothetical protein